MTSIQTIQAVKAALSPARLSTYEAAAGITGPADPAALDLYAWHAQVSGALMAPLHVCEVVVRNAVSDALEAVYGPRWPWSPVFLGSLPAPHPKQYDARRDITNARNRFATTGKVIPELKFVFWQKMFTNRFDGRIWQPHLYRVFPGLNAGGPFQVARLAIYQDLDVIRELRNRIAHHEPIFARNLTADLDRIRQLVAARCPLTEAWMMANQQATTTIAAKP